MANKTAMTVINKYIYSYSGLSSRLLAPTTHLITTHYIQSPPLNVQGITEQLTIPRNLIKTFNLGFRATVQIL